VKNAHSEQTLIGRKLVWEAIAKGKCVAGLLLRLDNDRRLATMYCRREEEVMATQEILCGALNQVLSFNRAARAQGVRWSHELAHVEAFLQASDAEQAHVTSKMVIGIPLTQLERDGVIGLGKSMSGLREFVQKAMDPGQTVATAPQDAPSSETVHKWLPADGGGQ
jgi:hypothetical protein